MKVSAVSRKPLGFPRAKFGFHSKMGDTPQWVLDTKLSLESIIKKPKLTEKLLQKPPFRFLHDIVSNVSAATGFASDLFSPDEINPENLQVRNVIRTNNSKGREGKIAYLEKIIQHVASISGEEILARPGKIVAGAEPENTNQFLLTLAKVAAGQSPPTEESNVGNGVPNGVAEEPSESMEPVETKKRTKSKTKKEGGKKTVKKKKSDGDTPKKTKKSAGASEGEVKKKKVVKKKEDGTTPTKKKTKTKTEGKKKVVKKKPEAAVEAEPEPEIQVKEEPKPIPPPKEEPVQQSSAPARPQTARPAPPRIQSNVRTVEKAQLEAQVPVQ